MSELEKGGNAEELFTKVANSKIISQEEKDNKAIKKYEELFTRVANSDIIPREEKAMNLPELERCLDETFKKYGEINLKENNGKIFTTLSGGLDSTLCTAYLRKHFPGKEIHTFTLGGDEKHPDIVNAKLASDTLNTKHHAYIPTSEDIQGALIDYNKRFPNVQLSKAVEVGDFDCFLLYQYISKFNEVKNIIAHDGIDELIGGYWEHRKTDDLKEKEGNFVKYWKKLVNEHLRPLVRTADNFNINVLSPYLDQKVIDEVSKISLNDRTDREVSKKPLREIAKQMNIPEEIINRKKEGFVGATKRFINK